LASLHLDNIASTSTYQGLLSSYSHLGPMLDSILDQWGRLIRGDIGPSIDGSNSYSVAATDRPTINARTTMRRHIMNHDQTAVTEAAWAAQAVSILKETPWQKKAPLTNKHL
jgi:hypothetical protein